MLEDLRWARIFAAEDANIPHPQVPSVDVHIATVTVEDYRGRAHRVTLRGTCQYNAEGLGETLRVEHLGAGFAAKLEGWTSPRVGQPFHIAYATGIVQLFANVVAMEGCQWFPRDLPLTWKGDPIVAR